MKVVLQRCFAVMAVTSCLLGCTSSVFAAEFGDLTGKFIYEGNPPTPEKIKITADADLCGKPPALVDESLVVGKDGGLANVLIYIRSRKPTINPDLAKPPAEAPVLDNVHCQFVPHLTAVYVDHPVILKNSDPKPHNINIQPIGGG